MKWEKGKEGKKELGTDLGVWFLIPSLQVQQSYEMRRYDTRRYGENTRRENAVWCQSKAPLYG
jgi:hypothetical protein